MVAKATDRSIFQSVVVPMVSPFTTDGAIDAPAARRIVDHLLAPGTAGIFALGTTGEASSIPSAERARLVETVAAQVAHRAMVYAGISGNCLRASVNAGVEYRRLGADALVAHVPFYFALSDIEIESYYLRLADAVPLPLVLYNIPQTTHHSIALKTLERLMRHDNIVAIKDSAGDAERLSEMLRLTGGRGGFPVLLGSSPTFTHGLKLGAVGLVPSGSHLVPQLYQAMFEAAMAQRWEDVERLQKETDAATARYAKAGSLGKSLGALKAILEKQGLCGRTMLPPLLDHVSGHGDTTT